MCLSKSKISFERFENFTETVEVPCGVCWQCRLSRLNDFVGRSLAEASTSLACCAVTLTYRDCDDRLDDLADIILTPSHFQKFIRSLRRRGHSVRYLVAGEYGAKKGRAHFHALLFFQSPPPQWEDKTRSHIKAWPHGHVYVDWSADERAVRYVCKYMLKDIDSKSWISMSKKPPLGAQYFKQRAARILEAGVCPTGFDYLPPGGSKSRPYTMTGYTRRQYLECFVDLIESGRGLSSVNEWIRLAYEKRDLALWRDDEPVTEDEFLSAFVGHLTERSKLFKNEDIDLMNILCSYSPDN